MGECMKRENWSTNKADKIFSSHIRERDKVCYFCPNPASQCSHFWGRANSATRYDPENCNGICGGCHMRHEGNKQGLYRTRKLSQLGTRNYNELQRRAQSTVKRRDAIAHFQAWYNELHG